MNTAQARAQSARLADLLSREQAAMADFLLVLAEFDRQRLWEPLGFVSLWHYLHRELGLSRATAFHRKVAAQLLQAFPSVEAPLRDGRLCLSSVVELSKVLTRENEAEVLPRFFHRSAREAREVVAELVPRVDLPERVVVTALSSPSTVRTSELSRLGAEGAASEPRQGSDAAAGLSMEGGSGPSEVPARSRSGTGDGLPGVEPLSADLRRLHVTVSRRFLEKLDAARDALSHKGDGLDVVDVLEAGLDLLLARQAKRRGLVAKPRKPEPAPSADFGPETPRIPAEVRRAVWKRDGSCCQWPMASGERCGSKRRLQLDHIIPRARGGPSTVENLRVLCAFHNDLSARLVFGEEWMRRSKRREGAQDPAPPA